MGNYIIYRKMVIEAIFKLMKIVAFIDGQPDDSTRACLDAILPKWCSGKLFENFEEMNGLKIETADEKSIEKLIIECLEVLLLELDKSSFQILKEDLQSIVMADKKITEKEDFAMSIINEYLEFVDIPIDGKSYHFEDSMSIDRAIGILYCFMMCVDGTIAAEEESVVKEILKKWDDLSARKILYVFENNRDLRKKLLGNLENVDISVLNDRGLIKVKQAIAYLKDNAERNLKLIFIDHLAKIAKADNKIHPNERYFWELIKNEWKDLQQLVA